MARKIRLEDLLGRRVVDPSGRSVGRIESVHAEQHDGELLATEFRVGAYALLDRLAGSSVVRGFLAGTPGLRPHLVRIRWDEIDLSDPTHPRLCVPAAQVTNRTHSTKVA
jgi:sporulation protein YlmC with PRC-barrel domain